MIEPGEADGQVFPRALELWRPLPRPGGCLVASGFVPAHRLSTVRHAQRIFVLEAGRVADSGTHEEPVTSSGPGPRR